MAKTDRKNQKNIKTSGSTARGRGSKSRGNQAGESVSGWKVFRVILGMVLLFAALFLVLSFTSYLHSGASDFSFCESHEREELFDDNIIVNNGGGKLGVLVSYFLINQCFGLAAYFIPVFLLIFSLRLIGSFRFNLFKWFVKLALLMLCASFVLSVVSEWIPGIEDWHVSMGGGHGDYLRALLYGATGSIGVFGVAVLLSLCVVIYFSKQTVDRITEFFRFRQLKRMKEAMERGINKARQHADDEYDRQEQDGCEPATHDYRAEGAKTLVFDGDGNFVEVPVEEAARQEAAAHQPAGDEKDRDLTPATAQPRQEVKPAAGEGTDEPGFTIDALKKTEMGDGNIERGEDELAPYDPRLDLEHYQFPPLSLLEHGEDSDPQIDLAEQNANKERIIYVLKSFGVEIRTIKATIGPTITLYEITLAEGTRINKIRNLEDDIALSLAADGIRIIAPIPGKGTVGIEVPNKKKCIVSMESILNSKTYQESKMELPCAMGKTITNEVFMVDLAKAPHMLVAGATGQGKSVGLNAIVTSLLYKKHPSELKMVMVDPKKVEFSVYSPIANQFLAKLEDEEDAIITDNQRVVKTLNALCKLMDDRYMLLKQAHVRNIKEYNEKFKARKLSPLEGHEYMPYYVVIIDEFGDLIMTAGKEIELPICRIAQLARAVGIHMIIATQRPTTSIITGTIKANFPARVAFKVSAMMDSRIILDRPGANQLIGRGDMLYLQNADPVRVQCAFVDTPEVNRICEYISGQQKYPEMTYLPEPPMDEGEGGSSKDVDMSRLDPLFAEAARTVVSKQQGSTSLIQRQFSIGYNRAGRLMDQLEKASIVGPQIGSKPREVLIQDLLTLDSVLTSLNAN